MRKLFTLLPVLVLLVVCAALLPTDVRAAGSGTCGDNLTWTLDDAGVLTISGTGDMKDYSSYAGLQHPFYSYGAVKRIVIEEGVTSIGQYAFYVNKYKTSPLSITIPSTIKHIGKGAFEGCDLLTDVYITDPSSWCRIDFEKPMYSNPIYYRGQLHILDEDGKEKKQIVLDKTVTQIPDHAFARCSLSSIIIPESVTTLEWNAFRESTIEAIFFVGEAPAIDSRYSPFYSTKATIYTRLPWDESILQEYQGDLTWYSGAERVEYRISDNTRRFYKLNEALELPEIAGTASFTRKSFQFVITEDISIGSFDNDTTGKKSVMIYVEGNEVAYDYYVGNNGKINVVTPNYVPFGTGGAIAPSVSCMEFPLLEGIDYIVEYKSNTAVGNNAVVSITGLGVFEGWSTSSKFSILKADISSATVNTEDCTFNGNPQTPIPIVSLNGIPLIKDVDYIVKYIDNVQIGTATAQIIGIGNYTGTIEKSFKISHESTKTVAFNSNSTSVSLRDQSLKITLDDSLFCGYELYKDGIFLSSYSASAHSINDLPDSIAVSESVFSKGAGTYKLMAYVQGYSLTVVGGSYRPYASGAKTWKTFTVTVYDPYTTIAPTKLTALEPQIIDFCTLYLGAGADSNANPFPQTWSTSNSAVATVRNGIVTLHKAGKAIITAKVGNLQATWNIDTEALNVRNGSTLYYDASTKTVQLIYGNELLTQGKDYTVTKLTSGDVVKVTIQGCGLFSGTFSRKFDAKTGEPYGTPGDIDGNEEVNSDDVVQLLLHISLPDMFPIDADADFNGDSKVTSDDVVQLLLHISLPDMFPLDIAVRKEDLMV